MQGRPPKPTAIKAAEGNPGKRKLNQAEPKPNPVHTLKPPANSLADVRKFWRKYGPMLDKIGGGSSQNGLISTATTPG